MSDSGAWGDMSAVTATAMAKAMDRQAMTEMAYPGKSQREAKDLIEACLRDMPEAMETCPYCRNALKGAHRGQIIMNPDVSRTSFESARALICGRCGAFISSEYSPVSVDWCEQNPDHLFSKCVRMVRKYPLLPTDFGRRRERLNLIEEAVHRVLEQVVNLGGAPIGPIHAEMPWFKEASEKLFAHLVHLRMTMPEDPVGRGVIGSMESFRFMELDTGKIGKAFTPNEYIARKYTMPVPATWKETNNQPTVGFMVADKLLYKMKGLINGHS